MKEKFTPAPWRVTYTHTFDGYQGQGIIGSVVNVTIGDGNFPFGAEGASMLHRGTRESIPNGDCERSPHRCRT